MTPRNEVYAKNLSPLQTKVCSKCKIEKPIDDFYMRSKTENRKMSQCKKCHYESKKSEKKNLCVDCGVPCMGVRCLVHANKAHAKQSQAGRKKHREEVIAAGGKYTHAGTPKTEEQKRATSERMKNRPVSPKVIEKNKMRVGPLSPCWKGGRTIDVHGYVKVLVDRKYVSKHRIIMGQVLGRKLTSYETVHHRDGNRQNNLPENLELRMGAHGSGSTKHCPTCTCETHVFALEGGSDGKRI